MFRFETCQKVPEEWGSQRGYGGGGLVEVEGTVVWGRGGRLGGGGVYRLEEKDDWKK